MRFPRLTPLVKKMLISFVAAFLLMVIADYAWKLDLTSLLALWPIGSPDHHPAEAGFQLLTYPFVNPVRHFVTGIISWVFLWLVVTPFEERYGARRTLQLATFSVVTSGLVALGVAALAPSLAHPLTGVGPIIWSAIAAYAWSLRAANPRIMIFAVLPVSAKQLLFGMVGLPIFFFLFTWNISELAADLGAMGAGILFINWITTPRRKSKPPPPKRRPRRNAPFTVIEGGAGQDDDGRERYLN